jgi:hypothetical protein
MEIMIMGAVKEEEKWIECCGFCYKDKEIYS